MKGLGSAAGGAYRRRVGRRKRDVRARYDAGVTKPATDHLARDAEAARFLDRYGDDLPAIMAVLERQFAVLHNRSQVALTLAGIVVSTVGFSGRLVAGTNLAAQVCVVAGISLVLASAACIVGGVMHLRWLSMQGGETTARWLVTCLAYRDRKTQFYRVGVALLLAGLVTYAAAVMIMLLNPGQDALPARSRAAPTAPG